MKGKVYRNLIKRWMDILAASLGLLLLWPFFLFIAALIKRDSEGPVFFWCNRAGRFGKPFRMLKFRTMYETPGSYAGPPITSRDDDRITPVGRWLRDSKINELPQLWNVLKGEMSLVGPRPEDIHVVDQWPAEAKAEILSVRPGITSPASIIYHDEENRLSRNNVMNEYLRQILPDKMRLDQLYVRNQSLTADLDIIFWTLAIFIPIVARAKIPENLLFFGPLSRLVHRYLNWFVIDLIVSLFAFTLVGFIARHQLPPYWDTRQLFMLAVFMALIFSGINFLLGFNRILWRYATVNDGINLLVATSMLSVLVLIFNHLQGVFRWFAFPALPPQWILLMCLLAQIGLLVNRYRLRLISSISSRWLKWRRYAAGVGEKVLIVGVGESFQTLVQLLKSQQFRYLFQIVGVVDDTDTSQIGLFIEECRILGRTSDIPDLVARYDVGVLFFTSSHIPSDLKQMVCQLRRSKEHLRIALVPQILRSLEQQMTSGNNHLPDSLMWSPDSAYYYTLHDPETDLPNRYLFCEQLHHALAFASRYNTKVAVLMVDLTPAQPEDICLSRSELSLLMKQAARRLLSLKRKSDVLALLENSQFGLILENLTRDEDLILIANRIHETLSQPFSINHNAVQLHAEISVCSSFGSAENAEFPQQKMDWLMTHRVPLTLMQGGVYEMGR